MTELIVALDDPQQMAEQCHSLSDAGVRWFKLNARSMMHPERFQYVIRTITARGAGLFLDLKLYDTKDTVRLAMFEAIALGAKMLTVHAECASHLPNDARLKIIAVRRLTDGTAGDDPVAWETKAAGFVCPFSHVQAFRRLTDKIIITPGIRPAGANPNNHVSRATPRQASAAGADYIVVGRPIYAAPDPVEAAKHILREIADAPLPR